MKLKFILIILLSALSLTAFAQQPQKNVAVFVKGDKSDINKFMADEIVNFFSKNGKYIAVERTGSFLAEVQKEQAYQQTGVVNDSELSRLGKQFGVQIVCVVEISSVFETKHVSARLIDVETVEVINSSTENSPLSKIEELQKVAKKISEELLGPTVQEKAEAAAQKEKEQAEEKKRLEQAVKDGYMQVDNIMFVVTSSPPQMLYGRALDAAQEFRLGGFSDWRLPTTVEMSRIIDVCEMYYSVNPNFPFYCNNTMKCRGFGCAQNFYLSVWADGSWETDIDGRRDYKYTKISTKEQGKGWNTHNGYDYCVIFVRDVPAN